MSAVRGAVHDARTDMTVMTAYLSAQVLSTHQLPGEEFDSPSSAVNWSVDNQCGGDFWVVRIRTVDCARRASTGNP